MIHNSRMPTPLTLNGDAIAFLTDPERMNQAIREYNARRLAQKQRYAEKRDELLRRKREKYAETHPNAVRRRKDDPTPPVA
jgi:uncharacterized membrane protein